MRKRALIIFILIIALFQTANAKKESIFFSLKFGFIKGGEAELVISDTIYQNKKAIHYYLVGRTTGLTDKLFGVNDIYQTTVDAGTMLPLKSIRDVREGRYRRYNETFFYHDIDSIYSQRSGWSDSPENLVDIVSVFFYFINKHLLTDLQKGKRVSLPTYHADKISDVTITFIGEGKVDTELGKIDCYILTPSVDKGKLLNRSDGLKFYISKETNLPVLLEFDMRVGALRAVIEKYKIDGDETVYK